MTPVDFYNDKVNGLAKSYGTDMTGITVTAGSIGCPVMLVGWQHLAGEQVPFSTMNRSLVRAHLARMGLDSNALAMTTVIKCPTPAGAQPADPCVGPWVHLLFEEIKMFAPKAIVLMGLPTATAVLGLKTDMVKMRGYRFAWPGRCEANFFVTHGIDDIDLSLVLTTEQTIEWAWDLKAVFEVDKAYFDRIQIIRG